MVRLVTETPEPRNVEVDKLLGSFQRSEGSILGSIGEGVATGVNTLERGLRAEAENQQTEINDELFNLLLGTDAVTQFSHEIRSLDAKAKQKGRVPALTQGRVRNSIRSLQSQGVPEEVIAYTFRQVTGASPFQLLQSLAPQTTDQRDLLIDFLKSQNQVITDDGVPITDLDDVDLEAFAAEIQFEFNQLEDSKRRYTIENNNENLDQISARIKYQKNVLPNQMRSIKRQVNSWIQQNIPDEMLEKIYDEVTGELRSYLIPDLVDPETLTGWLRTIGQMEAEFISRNNSDILFALNSDQFDRAMSTPRYFFNELRRMVNGEANLESLNAIETVAAAESTHALFRDNPRLRPALTFLNHLGPVIANLGLEGFIVEQDITNEILLPAMNGSRVRFADLLNNHGSLSTEEQSLLVETLTNQFLDVRNDMETRGQALKLLLPSLSRSGIDDPNFYKAMLSLLADPNGALLALQAMENPAIKAETRRNLQRGLLDYKEIFEVTLEQELFKQLEDPIFYGLIDVDSIVDDSTLAEISRFYKLGEFVKVDLKDGTLKIDSKAIKTAQERGAQIGDKELAIIVRQFQNINAQFADDLSDIQKINTNFNAAKDVLSTDDEQLIQQIQVELNDN